jgi:type IX secretion system PorP/SprF family membrane protein
MFKMIKSKVLLIFVLVLSFAGVGLAQDPHFSQYYANRLYLNPAFAGSEICPRLSMNYRNQWPGLGHSFITYTASFDAYVPAVNGGVGLQLINDVQGDGVIKTTGLDAMYAYTIEVSKRFSVAGGFQASYVQRKLDWGSLVFPDMIDEYYGIIYNTKETTPVSLNKDYFDFSAGAVGFGQNFYFGVAVHHLAQPEESFYNSSDAILPRKYTAHFGAKIPLQHRNYQRGELSISPNFMYQRQLDFEQLNYGLYLQRKSVTFGVWFRNNLDFHFDSFIMLIGFVQDQFKLSYSYDLTVSNIAKETLGAHEVTLAYQFPCRLPSVKRKAIKCPEF